MEMKDNYILLVCNVESKWRRESFNLIPAVSYTASSALSLSHINNGKKTMFSSTRELIKLWRTRSKANATENVSQFFQCTCICCVEPSGAQPASLIIASRVWGSLPCPWPQLRCTRETANYFNICFNVLVMLVSVFDMLLTCYYGVSFSPLSSELHTLLHEIL